MTGLTGVMSADGKSGTDPGLFADALPSGNALVNALGADGSKADGSLSTISGANAVAAFGAETSSLADALGRQGGDASASRRIGR